MARLIIRAYLALLEEKSLPHDSMLIGWDQRASSMSFVEAVTDELLRVGIHVVHAGLVPTPLIYHAIYTRQYPAGIIITASHLPEKYNGIKFVHAGRKALPEEMARLRELTAARAVPRMHMGEGRITRTDIVTPYVDDLITRLRPKRPSFPLVIDTGSGTAGPVVRRIMERLGWDARILCETPQPGSPYHLADPSKEETLRMLREAAAAARAPGFALDGDADRLGVLDEQGKHCDADMLPTGMAAALAMRGITRKPIVIVDVKASQYVEDFLHEKNIRVVRERTGHIFIENRLRHEDGFLAGELSGHVFLRENWYGDDDAIVALFTLLTLLAEKNSSLKALVPENPYISRTGRTPVSDQQMIMRRAEAFFQEDDSVKRIDRLDGVRVLYEDGWLLVRPSNTEPIIAWRAEARTYEALTRLMERLIHILPALKDEDMS